MTKSLKTNSYWSLLTSYGNIVIQMIFSIVFARLIDPVFFGTIATLVAIFTIQKIFLDAGLYQALVKLGHHDKRDFDSVFTFALVVGILLSLSLWLFAVPIASYFEEPRFSWLLPIGGTVILLSEVFHVVMRSYFMINLDFRLPAFLGFISRIFSSIIALIFFYVTREGLLTLFLRECIIGILTPLALFLAKPISLRIVNPVQSLKRLFSFGLRVFMVDQVEALTLRISQLYISRVFGLSELGYYSRADQYKEFITTLPSISMNKVLFATFASKSYKDERGEYRVVSRVLFLLVLFVASLSYIIADDLFVFLFGVKWIGSVPLFRILLLGGIFFPLVIVNFNAMKLFADVKLYFRVALGVKGLLPLCVLGGALLLKLDGVAWGTSFYFLISFVISSFYGGGLIGFRIAQQLKFVGVYYFVIVGMSQILVSWDNAMWLKILILVVLFSVLALIMDRLLILRVMGLLRNIRSK